MYRVLISQPGLIQYRERGVAQLVARTAGGREVAGSSPVTPTREKNLVYTISLLPLLYPLDPYTAEYYERQTYF